MKIELEVKVEVLAGVLDGANSDYWCSGLDWPTPQRTLGGDSCWLMLLRGQIPYVIVTEDRSEEGERSRTRRVSVKKIARAVQLMLAANHWQLGNVLLGYESDQTDGLTGDALLQYATFGEERYG